nr:aminoglycoside phosphotransferase family protein [Deinococcus betulae]
MSPYTRPVTLKPEYTPSEAAAILQTTCGLTVTDVQPLAGGHFSQAFGFEADGRRLVARFGTQDAAYRKDAYAGATFARVLPVPRVLQISAFQGGTVAVSERAPGRMMSEYSNDFLAQFQPARLELLASLAQVDVSTTTGYGWFDHQGQGGFSSWHAFLAAIMDPCEDGFYADWHSLFGGPLLDRVFFEQVYAQVMRMARYLPEVRGLVHNDLSRENVLMDGTHITGVIDWANALYGDPVYEAAKANWRSGGEWAGALQLRFSAWPDYKWRLLTYTLHVGLDDLRFYARIGEAGGAARTADYLRHFSVLATQLEEERASWSWDTVSTGGERADADHDAALGDLVFIRTALAVQLAEVALAAPVSGHAVLVNRSDRTVVRVESARGPFVVKLDTVGDGLTREAEAREYLRTYGVLINPPTAGPSGEPAWVVLPWVEGEALSSSTPVQAQRKVGALLARIHALPGGRPPPQNQTWAEWMLGWVRHALAYWQASGAAPENVGGRLSRWWQGIEPLLRARGHHLILFDGKPEHLIVTSAGELELIDVEDLRAGDGLMDLAVIALHEPEVLQGVLEGYASLSTDEKAVLAFYQVLRALAAAEWDESRLTGERRDHFLQLASRYLPT